MIPQNQDQPTGTAPHSPGIQGRGLFMRVGRWIWIVPFLCSARPVHANGIDLPVALGFGLGVVLPLLLVNAAMEAPIIGLRLGVKVVDLWWSCFRANVWSLLSGLPALLLQGWLAEFLLPINLTERVQVFPLFLLLAILVFFVLTVAAEYLSIREAARRASSAVGGRKVLGAVIVANLASYAVLGPLLFYLQFPRSELQHFEKSAIWAEQTNLVVVAANGSGHLMGSTLGGASNRVIVPHEVRDYVVSAELDRGVYRGADNAFYLFGDKTNRLIQGLPIGSRAPQMDFSPKGRYAAFCGERDDQVWIQVFDSLSDRLRNVTPMGKVEWYAEVTWSLAEDVFYYKAGKEYWEITLGESIEYRLLKQKPDNLADHYGRLGDSWSGSRVRYQGHRLGNRSLRIQGGLDRYLLVSEGANRVLKFTDPTQGLQFGDAILLNDGREVLLDMGGYVYLIDVSAKRIGPILPGGTFIALAPPFSKKASF